MSDLIILILAACAMALIGFFRTRRLTGRFMEEGKKQKEKKDD